MSIASANVVSIELDRTTSVQVSRFQIRFSMSCVVLPLCCHCMRVVVRSLPDDCVCVSVQELPRPNGSQGWPSVLGVPLHSCCISSHGPSSRPSGFLVAMFTVSILYLVSYQEFIS